MLLNTFNFLKLRLEGDKEELSPRLEYSNVEIPLLPLNRPTRRAILQGAPKSSTCLKTLCSPLSFLLNTSSTLLIF